MIFALDINETRPYSLRSDVEGEKTIFQIGVIDGVLFSAIEDTQTQFAVTGTEQAGSPDISVNIHGKQVELVKFGLKGWERFKDRQGKDVSFATQQYHIPRVGTRTGVHQDCLRRLTKEYITELAGEIQQASTLTKDSEKN